MAFCLDANQQDIVITMSHPGVGAGGGFLVGADDVVQPFHLPKYKYQPFAESTLVPAGVSAPRASVPHDDIDMPMGSQLGLGPKTPLDVNAATYELETMDVDSDGGLEEVPITVPESRDQSEPSSAPKTMRELAEDAARQDRLRNEDTSGSDSDAGGDLFETDTYRPSPRPSRDRRLADSGVPPRPLRVNLKLSGNTASKTTPSGALDVTPTSTKQRKGARRTRAPPRHASAQGKSKKRARDDDSDEHTTAEEDSSAPTPKKRATGLAKASTTTTPAPSTRTLRPRAPKTPVQLQEAEEREEVYRRAIGR